MNDNEILTVPRGGNPQAPQLGAECWPDWTDLEIPYDVVGTVELRDGEPYFPDPRD